MGQLAVSPGDYESPSIGNLRQLLQDLDNYLKILGDIGEEFPTLVAVEGMRDSLKKFDENLQELRESLKEDGETCKELDDAIIKIKANFNEEDVLTKFSMFLRRLKKWKSKPGDEEEEKADSFRIKLRRYFEIFKDELEQAVENRCNPSQN